MAYVQVPKDLTRVKTKILFNLTKRQLICFGLAALVGVPTYLMVRKVIGNTVAACLMVVLMLPFFFLALYEKDGRPLEKILASVWKAKVQRQGIRVYKTDNFYKVFQNKEELNGEKRNGQRSGKHSL